MQFKYGMIVVLLLFSVHGNADELHFEGVLGNSGASGETLAAFAGQPASGIGPILDDQNTIWERGGSRQLNRYAVDGRLLSTYELPESTDRNDQMTRVDQLLLFEIRGDLYVLPMSIDVDAAIHDGPDIKARSTAMGRVGVNNAEPGARPERIPGRAEVISSNSIDGKVAILDSNELFWLDPSTRERISIVKTNVRITWLHLGDDGTVFGFGGGEVYAWKNGLPLEGFSKGFNAERPQMIGDYWYAHGWHGTIHRLNTAFEPEPGVVLGGASGTFIGYLPESSDITNGRGLLHIRGNLFAVSGLAGVVQLLVWSEEDSQFTPVRRIGPLYGLNSLAIDSEGNIWTPRGSWRWSDSAETPHTLGDVQPTLNAQPVMLDGRTICLLKQHYSYVQLARGPLIDASGWSHFDIDGVEEIEFSESITGAAAFPDSDGRMKIIVTERNGKAIEFAISLEGRMLGQPKSSILPGLGNCTSLAWFEDRLLAADGGEIIVFKRTESSDWSELNRLQGYGDEIYIHSDGRRLAVSDTDNDKVYLFDSLETPASVYDELNGPRQVAVSGDRVAVYDAGNQRIVKLKMQEPVQDSADQESVLVSGNAVPSTLFTDDDFLEMNAPGGIPFEIALLESPQGLAVSVKTSAPEYKLGIANSENAFILTGGMHFQLPPGDWSNPSIAAALETPSQRERISFLDHRALHAPFSENPNDWDPFDLTHYREIVAERKQQIRIPFEQPSDGRTTLVIENEAGDRVRNLVSGRSFSSGEHVVVWDGLDETGRLVPPGTYRWRGVTHPGIEPHYRMNFSNGGEDSIHPWGPNHGLLHHAVTNGELIFFASPVTEGGWALLALDAEGNFVQGYEHQQGFGIGHNAIAADENYLYCAQDGFGWGGSRDIDFNSDQWTSTWKLTIARYDIQTGKVVEYPGGRRAFEADLMEVGPGSAHPDMSSYNLGGLTVLDGKLYVGSRDENAVLVFDADTGENLKSIPLEDVRHLTVSDEVFAATDRGVIRLSDQRMIFESDEIEISGIAVAPNGDILVSDRNSHQVLRFNMQGDHIATIGEPGGAYQGAYDRNRMVNPAGLTFGPNGKLWVTETRWNPKRIMAWDLTENEVVYEKFGMPHYGGDGSGFDPESPRRWIGLGCFWDVDLDAGSARPTHIMSIDEGHFEQYRPHSYSFFREAGRTFLCARGKIALISEVMEDDTIRDIAAAAGTHHFAYGCNWSPPQSYVDAFYEKWPAKRTEERPGKGAQGKPWAQRTAGVLWVDRNGDGRPQQEEFDFCEEGVQFADGAWGHRQNSLTFHFPAVEGDQTKVVAIQPDGFLPNGIPDYPTLDEAIAEGVEVDLTPGYKRNGVATARDRFGRFFFNSDPEMNAYDASGRHLWRYPNNWSDVHGSHDAPLPETGVMQGTLGILGVAPFDDQADVFFMNGNHGRCFLLTTDGLYLDEVFSDVRVSYLKNEYRLGGEIFGGAFDRSESDGRYYLQIGHGPYRIYELIGISEAQRISGEVIVSQEQIATAERRGLREIAEQHTDKTFSIPGTINWDQSGQFRAELTASVENDQLHLTWKVEDRSPWINNGRDWTTLFASGDTVDLQIGVNQNADPQRRKPILGDKRLMIAPFEGAPVAVLYEHRKPNGENPIEFTSPWRGEKVDHVQRLPDARIEVHTSDRDYVVDAFIPLTAIGLTITEEPLRVDFGVTYGDADGTETQLRSYWSNGATMLVDDIPGEIMLHPNLWRSCGF